MSAELILSDDPRIRIAALEAAILGTLGYDADDVPIRRWAQTYRELSRAVLKQTEFAGRPTGDLDASHNAADVDAVWALVYGARSFHVASDLLGSFGRPDDVVLELGAGWGPTALVAAARGLRARTVEVNAAREALGRRLFCELGLERQSRIGRSRPADGEGASLAVWSYSLREMAASAGEGAKLVLATMARMSPDARAIVFESGSRASSAFVMELRDALQSSDVSVVAPCVASGGCPLRIENDWCHFTWRFPLGPVGQRVAASAGRKGSEVHVSWLAVDRRSPEKRPDGSRVLDVRDLGKQGLRVTVCAEDGLRLVDVPKKVASEMSGLGRDASGRRVVLKSSDKRVMRLKSADELRWVDARGRFT